MVETAGTSRFVQRFGEISFRLLDFQSGHPLVPFLDMRMRRRQFVVSGVEKIFQHPEQVKVNKARFFAEQNELCASISSNGSSFCSNCASQELCWMRHWSRQPRPNL